MSESEKIKRQKMALFHGFRKLRQLGDNLHHMHPEITKAAMDEIFDELCVAYDAILDDRGKDAAEAAWDEQKAEVWTEVKP